MKTKGQLEYLKIRIFTNIEDDIETKYGLFSQGYDNGYMQCQEDMGEVNIEINDKEMDNYISNYINDLPSDWTSNLDMYLAMKNAMIEALSYPNKYSQTNSLNKQD